MKAPILKRVAHWARHDLASNGLTLNSGQMTELIAACLGFNSQAAFTQSEALDLRSLTAPAVVQLDLERAIARCQEFVRASAAKQVADRLAQILDRAGTRDLMFVSSYHADTKAFVRHAVLSQPRMAGVVDDLEARVQRSMAVGFEDNDMLRLMASNSGPVQSQHSMTVFQDGVCALNASGEYKDAQGVDGSFELEAVFKPRSPRVYLLDQLSVVFKPGEFEDLIVDHFADINWS